MKKFKEKFYQNKIKKFKQEIHNLDFELDCVMLTKFQRIEVECRKDLANKGIGYYTKKLELLKECNNG